MIQLHDQPIQDQRIVQADRTWEQFKLIQQGFANSPGVRLFYYAGTVEILMPGREQLLTQCVLMAQTSRLEAVKTFRRSI